MAILIRKGRGVWSAATRKSFDQEYELRDLLLNTPELIEVLDGRKLLLTKEAGLSGGTSADLLGVTSDGDILIVEAKLAKNYEIRRKIIGQIFEYAARLWKTDYATFNDYFKTSQGQSLQDRFAGGDYDDFKAEQFRTSVDNNLRQGRFHLLIAVDYMNDDLRRILTYISSRGDAVKLEALEVLAFQQGETEILVPQRHAVSVVAESSARTPHPFASVEELLDRSTSSEMRSKLQSIVTLWRESGNQVLTTDKSFCLKTQGAKKLFSMFWATPNEEWGLQPNFGGMIDAGMPHNLIDQLRKRMAEIPGVPHEKTLVRTYPVIRFLQLPQESVVRFTQLMIDTAKRWHAELASATEAVPPQLV